MRNRIFTLVTTIAITIVCHAQNASYSLIEAQIQTPSTVSIKLKTYGNKKKFIEHEAKCAALRIIMFDGIEGTVFYRPLLNQGTIALSENADYFEDLFFNRLSDVVKTAKRESAFMKAEKGEKATLYTVVVNYIQLKKDLEKNKIKKQLGI